MTTFAQVAPTAGDQGNSFEWIWDINIGTKANPNWVNIPDITGLNPSAPPTTKDGSTYANKGGKSQSKVGEEFSLAVQVKGVKDNTGEFQPALLALLVAADAIGAANVIGYRYYHATSGVLAYQGTAAVEWSRANTDNDSLEFFSFVLSGQGDRVKIANPASGLAVPAINSATPPGRATGGQVVVLGARFTGITAATIGGVTIPTPANSIISDGIFSFVLPAGAAGSAPIVLTNAAGASQAFPYTRA